MEKLNSVKELDKIKVDRMVKKIIDRYYNNMHLILGTICVVPP